MTNLDNGMEFANVNGLLVYQFNNNISGTYYLCISEDLKESYQLFVTFPSKDLKGTSKQDIVSEVSNIGKLTNYYKTSQDKGSYGTATALVYFDMPVSELEQASKENDDRSFNRLLGKIQVGINDCYQKLTSNSNNKANVEQIIHYIKQTESDTKFINWLETNAIYGRFSQGINYEQIKQYYYASIDLEKQDEVHEEKDTTTSYGLSDNAINQVDHSMDYDMTKSKEHTLVRKLTKKPINNNRNYGFVRMTTLLGLIVFCTFIGIMIASLLIK